MPAAHAATTSTTAFMERLEQSESLGRAAEEMAKPMGSLLGEGPVSDALRGRPLGHALHPVLVQVPIGAVLSAAVLDVVQGRKAQAQSRLLMGLVAWRLARYWWKFPVQCRSLRVRSFWDIFPAYDSET